ncbi:MAG: hypothetical protein V2I63_07120 [Pseudomonadales bacterium]|jgi:folate-binding protein YgfZ|nr:hypothetical protein [Pseudomonadales bacterium]
MHPQWQQFLESRGAGFGDCDGEPCVTAFAAHSDAALPELADLSPLGLLRIDGPDAGRFFQGYATCDVRDAAADRSIPGALCTREGRTLATYRLWGPPDALVLRLHRALIVPVRDLLARYIVFSKAELSEPTDRIIGLGLAGEGADRCVAELCGVAPEENEVVRIELDHGPCTAIRDRGTPARFELWLDVEDAPALWQRLARHARPVPWSRWAARRLRAGFVELSPRTAGEYVPQALNLQASGMLNFTKGCYLGQEVVARMQYRGRLKKRLYRFRIEDCTRPPALGTPITLGGAEGREVGEVVASVQDEGACDLLAVVRIEDADAALFIGERALKPEPLAYEIPPLKAEGGA